MRWSDLSAESRNECLGSAKKLQNKITHNTDDVLRLFVAATTRNRKDIEEGCHELLAL
jgi:hypothetical protein